MASNNFGEYLKNNPGQVDSWDYIDAFLKDAGLDQLTDWAQKLLIEFGDTLNEDQFVQRIRVTDPYKIRFRANEKRRLAGKPILQESEILATERSMETALRQAGLPPGFYDNPQEDFGELIANDVSPEEFQARIAGGFTAVRNDPRIAKEMGRFYQMGITEADLAAFYLDPERAISVLEQQRSAATIAANAKAAGFGDLEKQQAERLASQGITADQARQGFGNVAAQSGLYDPLASEQGSISRDEAISATFDNNADAQQRIERRRAERQAGFAGGGSFQAGNKFGETGIGTSNS